MRIRRRIEFEEWVLEWKREWVWWDREAMRAEKPYLRLHWGTRIDSGRWGRRDVECCNDYYTLFLDLSTKISSDLPS
jgi:hypothetical protein